MEGARVEVLGVEHIDLTVTELQRSREFYATVLEAIGFKRFEHPASHASWSNGKLTVTLRPCSAERGQESFDRYRVGLHHLALKMKDRKSVEDVHDLVHRAGYTVLEAPTEYPAYGEGYYAVFFEDPDGMKIEAVHFPWGYWSRVQREGSDARPRSA